MTKPFSPDEAFEEIPKGRTTCWGADRPRRVSSGPVYGDAGSGDRAATVDPEAYTITTRANDAQKGFMLVF